jgi:hypothetical protein
LREIVQSSGSEMELVSVRSLPRLSPINRFFEGKPVETLDLKFLTNLIIIIGLTSWWDLYETFVNILKIVEEPHLFDPLLVNWRPTTSGISLFHPIPERNCSSAGIPGKKKFY